MKRGWALLVIAWGVLFAGLGLPPASAKVVAYDAPGAEFREWFSLDESLLDRWTVVGDARAPDQVSISARVGLGGSALRVEPQHRLMVLYPKPSSAYDQALSKILTVFESRGLTIEVTAINFRRDAERGKAAIAFAEKNEIDLIFAMGSDSTAWLWENYRGGKIPVVSVTSKDPVILGQATSYDLGTGENFAFTSLNMPVEAQLAYVFQLRPELKNLAVLVDQNNVSAMETQARPIGELATARGIRVLTLAVQDSANAAEELEDLVSDAVAAMRKNDVALENSLFWITGSTSVFREIDTIGANSDRVPVLSVVPEVVQQGADSAVLSIGISFESNAHLATIYAIKVLTDEVDVGDLPVGVVSPPDIAVNFLKAREIGLSIPFSFVEGATFIYDYDGKPVRHRGVNVANRN